jgi:hypothetical protein
LATAPGDAAPDWVSSHDLHCPLCDYNLRGLTEPRCPECGYRFQWAELIDEKLKLHPYLFEHHPRRNVWSFWKTAVGGLRPARFWKTLHPAHVSRPRRLLAYWVVASLLALMAAVVPSLAVRGVLYNAAMRVEVLRPKMWSGQIVYITRSGVQTTAPTPPGYFDADGFREMWESSGKAYAIGWAVAAIGWPVATFLVLMIFQISMRRAKVLPIHVRRVVIYSFDAVLWGGLCVLALSGVAFLSWNAGKLTVMYDAAAAFCLPVVWVVVVYRLGRGYRDYLKFDHPWATVIATQVIVVLAAAVIAVNLLLAGSRY